MKNIFWFVRMQLNRLVKPKAVHTEAIHIDRIWKSAKEYAKNNKAEWFVFTPVNFELAKYMFGFRGSKKDYEKIILNRYKWLGENRQTIQLHVHLRYFPDTLSYKEKERIITSGYKWLKSNGFNPRKIVFGWWIHDDEMERIAKKLGLEVVKYFDYYWFHDYDFANELIRH